MGLLKKPSFDDIDVVVDDIDVDDNIDGFDDMLINHESSFKIERKSDSNGIWLKAHTHIETPLFAHIPPYPTNSKCTIFWNGLAEIDTIQNALNDIFNISEHNIAFCYGFQTKDIYIPPHPATSVPSDLSQEILKTFKSAYDQNPQFLRYEVYSKDCFEDGCEKADLIIWANLSTEKQADSNETGSLLGNEVGLYASIPLFKSLYKKNNCLCLFNLIRLTTDSKGTNMSEFSESIKYFIKIIKQEE